MERMKKGRGGEDYCIFKTVHDFKEGGEARGGGGEGPMKVGAGVGRAIPKEVGGSEEPRPGCGNGGRQSSNKPTISAARELKYKTINPRDEGGWRDSSWGGKLQRRRRAMRGHIRGLALRRGSTGHLTQSPGMTPLKKVKGERKEAR